MSPTESLKLPNTADSASVTPPYVRLIVKYSLLALYGAGSAIVGVPTLRILTGSIWETIWPLLVLIAALASLAGVIRSWHTDKHALEVISTVALLAALGGYSVLITIRAFIEGDFTRLPIALLPITCMVAPYGRLLDIVGPIRRRIIR